MRVVVSLADAASAAAAQLGSSDGLVADAPGGWSGKRLRHPRLPLRAVELEAAADVVADA